MKQRFAVLALSLILSACEITQQRHDAYNASLDNYIGEGIDVIIDQLGYADSVSESAEGNRVFVYSQYHVTNSSIKCSMDKSSAKCKGGDVSEHWCKTYFEVDDRNKVIRTSFKGNHCGNCASGVSNFCLNEVVK